MNQTAPHYLLFTQANSYSSGGRWKFVLEQVGSESRIVESDDEPDVRGERLHLLAVVRGLEALEQPSHVTLITPSRFVGHGIRSGLASWRQQDWQVEVDDNFKPLRHADMWKRIDLATQFHKISCRVWHFDAPQDSTQKQASDGPNAAQHSPFVAPFAGTSRDLPRTDRPNRIRVDDQVRKTIFRSTNTLMNSAVDLLVDRVKPIGQGRAYGYAVN
jgi:ribonuclease HI